MSELKAEGWGPEPDQHSRDNAGRMLDDPNYPTRFERVGLLVEQPDHYQWKTVSNLLAMLDEARRRLALTPSLANEEQT